MSKSIAILVLDYTPDYCHDCPCYDSEFVTCQALRENVEPYEKPDWCPLQEAPEYEPIYHDFDDDYELGWNACLDNILGVKEDEE